MTPKQPHQSIYSEALANAICEAVATSTLSLLKICTANDDFPNVLTVNRWRLTKPEFREKFLEARRQQAELIIEYNQSLAETAKSYTYRDKEGNERVDAAAVAAIALEVKTAQWHAARLLPKIYGDKTETTVKFETHEERLARIAQMRKSS